MWPTAVSKVKMTVSDIPVGYNRASGATLLGPASPWDRLASTIIDWLFCIFASYTIVPLLFLAVGLWHRVLRSRQRLA